MTQTMRIATKTHLAQIKAWLTKERDETGQGFMCNWGVIERAFDDEGLRVIERSREAVAFLATNGRDHDIAEVHPDHRGLGYGRVIAETMFAISRRQKVNVIEITCAPPTSAQFWEKMGFTLVDPERNFGSIPAYRVLRYAQPCGDGPERSFCIRFFEKKALHDRTVEPFKVYDGKGRVQGNNRLILPERALGYLHEYRNHFDIAVEISVNGERLCWEKAKYDNARALGVEFDPRGHPFIRRIVLPRPPA